MTRIIFFALIFFTVSCKYSKPTKNGMIKKSDTISRSILKSEKPASKIDSSKIVDIGYYDTYEKLPKLTFETITEKDFLSLEEQQYLQTSEPEQNKDFFYVQTSLNKHQFKKYRDYGGEESWSGFQYLGYYPTSKLFAIKENSTSEGFGFGQFFFLDSENDYIYNIVSFGDASVELPIPSINNKYFVYFQNTQYQHKNCDIGILKINDNSNPKNYLREYASYHSDEFAIEKIVWKTDNIFFVKGYEEVYEKEEWIKKYKYYKTEFE